MVTDLSLRGMILPTGRLGRGTLQAGGASVTSTSSLDDDPRLVGGKYCAVGNLIPFYLSWSMVFVINFSALNSMAMKALQNAKYLQLV